jgi:hypothetical protein
MAVPFLKKEKTGLSIRLSKDLYPAGSRDRLKEHYGDRVVLSADKGRYVRVGIPSGSEEDALEVLESLLYYSRHA